MGWLARYLEVGGDTDTYRTGLSPDQSRHATERSLFSVRYDATEVQLSKPVERQKSLAFPALHVSDSASTISLDDVRTLAFRPNSLPTSQHPSVVSMRDQRRTSNANVPGARERDGSLGDDDHVDACGESLRDPAEAPSLQSKHRHRRSLSRSSSVGVRSLHEEPVAEYHYDGFKSGEYEEGVEETKDLQFEMEGELSALVPEKETSALERRGQTQVGDQGGRDMEGKEREEDNFDFAVEMTTESAVKNPTPPSMKKPGPFDEPVNNVPGPFDQPPAAKQQNGNSDSDVFGDSETTGGVFNPFKAKQQKKALQRQKMIEQQLALQRAGLFDTSLDIGGVQQDLWRQRRQRKMYGVMEELDEELRDAAFGGPSPTQPIMIAPVQRWV